MKRLGLIGLLLLTLPRPSEAKPLEVLYGGLIGLQTAHTKVIWDIVQRGGTVTSPIFRPTYPLLITKTLITVSMIGAAESDRRNGHPRRALFWAVAGMTITGVRLIYDVRQLRRMP